MEAATTIAAEVLGGIVEVGVPWWGWTALVLMMFWGVLGPRAQDDEEQPEPVPSLDRVP